MAKDSPLKEENMHQMQYALLTEVLGRWKADIVESFLMAEEIDVVLIQGTVADLFQRARNLLKTLEDAENNMGETEDGE
jgi:hypothetical protein